MSAVNSSYKTGDLVLYHNVQHSASTTFYKFKQAWIGPYIVKNKISDTVYDLELVGNSNIQQLAHFNSIKKYNVRQGDTAHVTNVRKRGRPATLEV